MRRLWWRVLCQGSGKKTQTSSTEPAGSMVVRTSGALAWTTRTLVSSFCADALQGLGQAGQVDLHGEVVLVRVLLRRVGDGFAQAGTDFHDQGSGAAKLGGGVEHVVRVHRGVRICARNVNDEAVRELVPGLLAAALQAGAAADKGHRRAGSARGSPGSPAAVRPPDLQRQGAGVGQGWFSSHHC